MTKPPGVGLQLTLGVGDMEEEGDDACTIAFDLIAFPIRGFSAPVAWGAFPARRSSEPTSSLRTRRLCLRLLKCQF